MPTICLESNVKKELEELMLAELHKSMENPKVIMQAIRNKYGYTHSEFVLKLVKHYKARRKQL